VKLRSGQYGVPVWLDIAEVAVDVIEILSEVLPTEIPAESALDEVPFCAVLDDGLVVTLGAVLTVVVTDAVTVLEFEAPELMPAMETDDAVEAPTLEFDAAMLELVTRLDEEIELEDNGLDPATVMLELDGTILELDGTMLELDGAMLELDSTLLELDGAMLELDNTLLELDSMLLELDGAMLGLDGTTLELDGVMLELDSTTLELDGVMLELEGAMLELEASPDEMTELRGTVLELVAPEVEARANDVLAIELELAMMELIEEI
jgi:hypothetical protein